MSDILSDFYNNCDPLESADTNQYVDADEARGSRDLVRQFQSDLKNIRGGFLCFLFTGHVGCGKSSELRHLAERLKNPDPRTGAPAFYPVYMDAEEFIDSYDADPTDILLSIFAATARELKEIGIQLRDSFLCRRLRELQGLLFSEVKIEGLEANAPLPFLSEITAKISILKSDPVNRQRVREALGRETAPLKAEIALQFEKARSELAKKKAGNGMPYKDFVLILDNLEKINRVKGEQDGYLSQRQLFIESASQLLGLGAHVVYTVPLPLVINNGPGLAACYGSTPFVLPMIKVADRPPKRNRFEKGWETLRRIVELRLPPNMALDDVIEKNALEFLIQYSGGHTRHLVMFLRQAVTQVDAPPITLKAAKMAIADTVSMLSTSSQPFLPILAELEISPDQSIDPSDPGIKTMLQQLIILQYRNGGHEEDSFNPTTPWYSVHPIIRELNAFKRAVEAAKAEREKQQARISDNE